MLASRSSAHAEHPLNCGNGFSLKLH